METRTTGIIYPTPVVYCDKNSLSVTDPEDECDREENVDSSYCLLRAEFVFRFTISR